MAWVSITREVTTHAPVDRVWFVATDPSLVPLRDESFDLVSQSGTPRGTGSSYRVRTKPGLEPVLDVLYEVVAADAPVKYHAIVTTNGHNVTTQQAVIVREDDKTVLTWNIEADVPRLAKRRYLKEVVPELEAWLTRVALIAETVGST
jgi:hypothetical protein